MAANSHELDALHELLAKTFKQELEKEEPAPSLLNAARQYLKDNNVVTNPGYESDGIKELQKAFQDMEEELPKFN